MQNDILIVGGGPAGLMAAIHAAQQEKRVIILEQLRQAGMKLLASGGNKCNLGNTLEIEEFCRRFGKQWRFMLPALYHMPPDRFRDFLAANGVQTECPDGFHYFPVSRRALDVLEALLAAAARLKVAVRCSSQVRELLIDNAAISGVRLADGETLRASSVIIATGGRGYPTLGGLGIGYDLARQAGHELVPVSPAMTGLRSAEGWPGRCAGISFDEVEAFLELPGWRKQPSHGELLFTHHGVSGPAVIDFAGEVSARLAAGQSPIILKIRFFPDKDSSAWMEIFRQWQELEGKKHLLSLLSRLMPRNFAAQMLELAVGDDNPKAAEFRQDARRQLAALLAETPFTINATEDWGKAMVTRGGVALRQVDPQTLESRLVKGLFFAGEALDLDGPCGGFNLQWAFSSGALAGTHAGGGISGR